MFIRHLVTLSMLATAITVGTATALAQTAPPMPAANATNADAALPATLDTVIVKSPKNAAVMPYDGAYERLKRLQDSKLDRVRLQIKIETKQEGLKLSDVRVAIVNDSVSVQLPISAEGVIELPLRGDRKSVV